MNKISQIMCVIDPTSTEQPAMRRAAWLAKNVGAKLELFVSCYNQYLNGDRFFDSPSLESARRKVIAGHETQLEKLAEPLRSSGLTVRTAATWDHPLYEGIVRHAVAIGADIVFKDTHHHSALTRALFTNTDWNLLRTCPVPLWLVKPQEIADKPVFMAAIDPLNQHDKPAALDDQILVLSKMLAEKSNGEVHAFHSYDSRIVLASANAYIPVSLPLDEIEEEMHEHHEKRFNEITEYHGLDDKHTHLVSGLAHQELPFMAEKISADVVVMGAVARNRWKRIFIGATAERTLEHLPCDLLIIKPDWFHTPVEMSSEEAA
jgi:universal stress protein E